MENIGLQDSLLSRFDLLFVMLDVVDTDTDQMISDHVVRMHRYRKPGEQDGEVLPMGGSYVDMLTTFNTRKEDAKDAPMYEKYDALLHGSSRRASDKILTVDFMRKYINIAKCLKPKLTEQACEVISNEYSRLRSQDLSDSDMARTQPVTARTLETLIRLATAHAKARMAKSVAVQDANAAIELVQFAYFKKVLEKEKKKRRHDSDSSGDEGDSDTETATQPSQNSQAETRRSKRTRLEEPVATVEEDDEVELPPPDRGDLTTRETIQATETESTAAMDDSEPLEPIDDAKMNLFKTTLQKAFREGRTQCIKLDKFKEILTQESSVTFSSGETMFAIHQMTEDNQIMLADGMIFLI